MHGAEAGLAAPPRVGEVARAGEGGESGVFGLAASPAASAEAFLAGRAELPLAVAANTAKSRVLLADGLLESSCTIEQAKCNKGKPLAFSATASTRF